MRNNYNDSKKVFDSIINILLPEEKENVNYLFFNDGDFYYENNILNKNLCLELKIKDNRKNDIIKVLINNKTVFKITNDNHYYTVIQLFEGNNYIILRYVVNSHIMIPRSFLSHFGNNTPNGIIVNYLSSETLDIKKEKVTKYGTSYGYYDKEVEEYLSANFECEMGKINKLITKFTKGNIEKIELLKYKEIIMNFFDITCYRNPKCLQQFNENSFTSQIFGEYDHNYMLKFIFSNKFPHVFKDLEINIIINNTDSNFIINDSMISSAFKNNKEFVILPINPKACITLMDKEQHKQYMPNNKLYYLKVDKDMVRRINEAIFLNAKKYNENVIGDLKELKILKNHFKK